jgi:microsomal dipeptidase-like Zn-dependent dipeptidase
MVSKFGMASSPSDPDDLERVLDRVMAELERLDKVEDPDFTASLAKGQVSITLTVEGVDPLDAAGTALAAIRTAFHASGVATPKWPTFTSSEIVDLVDA